MESQNDTSANREEKIKKKKALGEASWSECKAIAIYFSIISIQFAD